MLGPFPSRGVWRRPGLRPVDLLVFAALLALLFGLLRLAPALNAPFLPKTAPSTVSTDPANLPYYAARSLLRMFIALGLSVLFTFVYATAAARLRRAEKVLVPVLDILQSVPVLGFLAVTVTAFINLFPGSELGLEWASIFAIFTSMAWNMTFAFYHSLISQPRDLDEAARVMRLTKWQRFWQLDVPSGMIPLVWNGMMSFGGAWFFLAASESISVVNHTYALPGIGSYVATAVEQGNLGHVGIAIAVMIVIVLTVNFLFWRPVVAWAERFRTEESAAAERPRSLVLDLLRRSAVPDLVARPVRPAAGCWTRSPGRSAWPSTRCSGRRCGPAPGTCSSSARSAPWWSTGPGGRLTTCTSTSGWARSATRSYSAPRRSPGWWCC